MVGATGLEPAASWSQTKHSTKLSYAPIYIKSNLKELLNSIKFDSLIIIHFLRQVVKLIIKLLHFA